MTNILAIKTNQKYIYNYQIFLDTQFKQPKFIRNLKFI